MNMPCYAEIKQKRTRTSYPSARAHLQLTTIHNFAIKKHFVSEHHKMEGTAKEQRIANKALLSNDN